MDQMSVARALIELKTLEKRINKNVAELDCVSAQVGSEMPVAQPMREEYEKRARAEYQSIQDLIKRRRAIKSALVKSNAAATVNINGKSMTVAEAIERKLSVQFEKNLRSALGAQIGKATAFVEKHNKETDTRLDELLKVTFGKDVKVKEEDQDAVAGPFLARYKAKLVDPLEADKTASKLEDDIGAFETEVDVALTESNARTEISFNA